MDGQAYQRAQNKVQKQPVAKANNSFAHLTGTEEIYFGSCIV